MHDFYGFIEGIGIVAIQIDVLLGLSDEDSPHFRRAELKTAYEPRIGPLPEVLFDSPTQSEINEYILLSDGTI